MITNGFRVLSRFDSYAITLLSSEHSALVKWEPHTKFSPHSHWGGEEIYVLSGTLFDEFGVYKKGTWIRSPHMSS